MMAHDRFPLILTVGGMGCNRVLREGPFWDRAGIEHHFGDHGTYPRHLGIAPSTIFSRNPSGKIIESPHGLF